MAGFARSSLYADYDSRLSLDKVLGVYFKLVRLLQDVYASRGVEPGVLVERLASTALKAVSMVPSGVYVIYAVAMKGGRWAGIVGYDHGYGVAGVEYRLRVELPDVYPAMVCTGEGCVGYGPLVLPASQLRHSESLEGIFVKLKPGADAKRLWSIYETLLSGDESVLSAVDTVAVYDRKTGEVYVLKRAGGRSTMVIEFRSGRAHTVPYPLEEVYRRMVEGLKLAHALA